jgi:hypothetical protein
MAGMKTDTAYFNYIKVRWKKNIKNFSVVFRKADDLLKYL